VVAFLPFLTEDQVGLYQPMLIPIGISILASVFLTISMVLHTPPMPRPWQRWHQRWRKPPSLPFTLAMSASDAEIIDMPPKPAAAPAADPRSRVPERPRLRLATTTCQPIGAVLDFLHGGLEIVAKRRTEMAAAFVGYIAWCKVKTLRPMGLEEFVEELEGLCQQCGIRIAEENDRHYLIDVQLVPAQGREVS
jgi:hypothetical protein